MRAREKREVGYKMLVTTKELALILSIGENNARLVGEKADSVVYIGKRRLYNLQKVENYINSQGNFVQLNQ